MTTELTDVPSGERCGTIAVIGRPNVGKSTLMNALIGEHVSITSAKPQTTRHRVMGVYTRHAESGSVATRPDAGESGVSADAAEAPIVSAAKATLKSASAAATLSSLPVSVSTRIPAQFIFVDTPGFQTRFSNALNRSMNKAVTSTCSDVDLVFLVLEAGKLSDADKAAIRLLPSDIPVIAVVNKLDRLDNKAEALPFLQKVMEAHPFREVVPVSAKTRSNLDRLLDVATAYLPEQPFIYEADMLTDRPERFLAAERIREKVFRLVGDELPYTCTVTIDKFETEGALRRIFASILVDRDNHKAMIIGKGGSKLKRISSEARQDMENLFGGPVYLETFVKVRSGWADDAGLLRSLGYE